MKSYQQLFAELKRRKVFQVAAVYGAVAFVLLQVADLLGQGLRLPDSFMPFITAVILIGFPLALILAWAFEVTPDGVQRMSGAAPGEIERIVAAPASKRWPAGLLALAGVGALLGGAWWAGTRMGPGDGAGAAAAEGARPDSPQLAFVEPEALAKVRELKVAARSSSFAFRGENPDIRTVGDSLGVQYVIEGSVRKAGEQLRITAPLIDAADGTHLWSDSFDRPMIDVFAIQTEIAQSIAEALRVPLGLEEANRLVTPTGDLEAYDLFLAARGRMRERGESLPEAIRLFEAAVARDSTWAPAWAGLAEAREVFGWYPEAWESPPSYYGERATRFTAMQEPAAEAARRALALDPDNASAHVALGSVHRNRLQWARAETEYARALELDPENPEAHLQYAQLFMYLGRLPDAIEELQRAIELDPGVLVAGRLLAAARLMAGQYEEALAELDRHEPSRSGLANLESWVESSALIALGRYDELRALPLPQMIGPNQDEEAAVALEIVRSGDIDLLPEPYAHPFILMGFGREDEAAERLLEDFRVDPRLHVGLHWMPLFDPIRDHPAYLQMVREANLEGVVPERPAS
ncbi:MAG TPA: tetratricopeptide repeat protein [Longimicrobiaceae bacterium]|nr:tetratricopeptide repeat protein [Longimicrobiaceae bacterium]